MAVVLSLMVGAFAVSACGGSSTASPTTTSGSTAPGAPAAPPTATATGSTPPEITSFTPTSGPVGSTVTITGSGFTGVNNVMFLYGAIASYTFVSDTQVTAIVPAEAKRGTLRLTTPLGMAISPTIFAVEPTLSTRSPDNGPVGTVVTINGTGMRNVTSVYFKSSQTNAPMISATIAQKTSAYVKVAVPSGAGTGKILLKYEGPPGSSPQSVSTATIFTVKRALEIT